MSKRIKITLGIDDAIASYLYKGNLFIATMTEIHMYDWKKICDMYFPSIDICGSECREINVDNLSMNMGYKSIKIDNWISYIKVYNDKIYISHDKGITVIPLKKYNNTIVDFDNNVTNILTDSKCFDFCNNGDDNIIVSLGNKLVELNNNECRTITNTSTVVNPLCNNNILILNSQHGAMLYEYDVINRNFVFIPVSLKRMWFDNSKLMGIDNNNCVVEYDYKILDKSHKFEQIYTKIFEIPHIDFDQFDTIDLQKMSEGVVIEYCDYSLTMNKYYLVNYNNSTVELLSDRDDCILQISDESSWYSNIITLINDNSVEFHIYIN